MSRKFRRAVEPVRWVGGVCAGLAYYFAAPVWSVRILFFLAIFFFPNEADAPLITAYLILWAFLPKWEENPEDFYEVTGD